MRHPSEIPQPIENVANESCWSIRWALPNGHVFSHSIRPVSQPENCTKHETAVSAVKRARIQTVSTRYTIHTICAYVHIVKEKREWGTPSFLKPAPPL